MAVGEASDFKVYQEQFFGGWTEVLTQASNAFNAASLGCIKLVPNLLKGNYAYESFMQAIAAGAVSRRDTTSVADATIIPMTQEELISVKLDRKIGPVDQTLDAFRKIGSDERAFSFLLGQQYAKGVQVDYLNSALRGLVAALTTATTTYVDKSAASPTTLATKWLPDGFKLLGDAGERVKLLVMHSVQYYDLLKEQITSAIYQAEGVRIMEGTPSTLNRAVLVTDAAPLIVTATPNDYWMLGLVDGAATIEESEDRMVTSDLVTGKENLIYRIQGEYAFNVSIKGHKWDVTNGGANPLDAAMITTTNWDLVANSIKDGPGMAIRTT